MKDVGMEILFIALDFIKVFSAVIEPEYILDENLTENISFVYPDHDSSPMLDEYKIMKDNREQFYPENNARPDLDEDRMMRDNREQLLEIVQDMLKDARYKYRQTDGPRLEHRKSYSYEIGFSLGIIRETYRHMLSIHRMVVSKYKNMAAYPTLFYGDYRLIEYFNNYEIVHRDEVKIDKLCELIMAVEIDELGSLNNMKPINDDADQNTTTKPALRSFKLTTKMDLDFQESSELKEEAKQNTAMRQDYLMQKEEAKLKSSMRQAYLNQKMGLPPDASTTRNWFQNGWPVEDTWDEYIGTY